MISGKNETSEKFGGIQTFEVSMLSGKNKTYEDFGGTEGLRQFGKIMIFGKSRTSKKFEGIQTFGNFEKNGTFENFGSTEESKKGMAFEKKLDISKIRGCLEIPENHDIQKKRAT